MHQKLKANSQSPLKVETRRNLINSDKPSPVGGVKKLPCCARCFFLAQREFRQEKNWDQLLLFQAKKNHPIALDVSMCFSGLTFPIHCNALKQPQVLFVWLTTWTTCPDPCRLHSILSRIFKQKHLPSL